MFAVCTVAFLASLLSFFSGFGLGTLLLPALALFMPLEQAVAATAVVHLLNGLFKLGLLRAHVDRRVVLRFGAPAIVAAFAGAWLLNRLGAMPALASFEAFDHEFSLMPIKLVLGVLLSVFALFEVVPRLRGLAFDPRWLPLGGVLSGFLGGLSGMQGALRSAFLIRCGLGKQVFVATGAAIGCLIDLSRLSIYAPLLAREFAHLDLALLGLAILAAFAGALLGHRLLDKTTVIGVQRLVAAMLLVFGVALIFGLI
ncbi:MAG: sulfite exporter TauE/SafE family protein [Lysobacteraceae bacterium]|nr:MAG: sulfite exporter TauE/SafE family protein [Xanthomonadaceae bacterium]